MDIFGDLSRTAKKPPCFGATGERQVYPLGKIPSKFGAQLDPIRGDPHGKRTTASVGLLATLYPIRGDPHGKSTTASVGLLATLDPIREDPHGKRAKPHQYYQHQ